MSDNPRDPRTPPRPDPDPDPLTAFKALIECTKARDFRGATRARKELRSHGWAVAPCGKGGLP